MISLIYEVLKMAKNLRQQLNYYRRKLFDIYAEEQASYEALGIGSIERMPFNLYQHLEYDDVARKGITRKRRGRTIRYYGAVAVRMQIASLKARTNKANIKSQFITNYLKAMENVGYSPSDIKKVEQLLGRLTKEQLTYMLRRGYISEIAYVYLSEYTLDIPEKIESAIRGINKEEFLEWKESKKDLTQEIKGRFKRERDKQKKKR